MMELAALLIVPIGLGYGAGFLVRLALRRRITGTAGAALCLAIPTLIAAIVTIRFPLLGLWDGILEGVLCGVAMTVGAHRLFADRRAIVLPLVVLALGFVVVEVCTRIFLGRPPSFAMGNGPRLFLTDMQPRGTAAPDALPTWLERRMEPDPGGDGFRFHSTTATKDVVCSIAYGPGYSGITDVSRERAEVYPDRAVPRAGATRRVLHVGDSMVYGFNVPRDQTFVADLNRMEPAVEHVNAGVPATAPDDYLVVLKAWVDREPFDLAVLYVCAENDMDLDSPHSCSNGQSILAYERGKARLRYPDMPRNEPQIGLRWLVSNSPFPYLGGMLVARGSAAAAFLGGAFESWRTRATAGPDHAVLVEHLEAILRTARDDLRLKHIPLAIVVLPTMGGQQFPSLQSTEVSRDVAGISHQLGIPELDATELIGQAYARGKHPVHPDGTHFSESGHELMAKWLHDRLAIVPAVDRPESPAASPPK